MRDTRLLLNQVETLKLELLNTPINELGVAIEGTFLAEAIATVRADLKRAAIRKMEPVFYLSTGYGCIAGSTIISLGFYDAHPLLKELNQEFRGWSYTESQIVDVLRHELGHAFCYAYKLYRTPEFRRLFEVQGNFFGTYPDDDDDYEYNPWSRSYVNPNGDHYAQKHPDEDFAETFSVWLTPRSGWRRRYRNHPLALEKLGYVDRVIDELGRQEPVVESKLSWEYERVEDVKETVAQFMRAKPARYYRRATGYIDPDLKALFRPQPRIPRQALHRDYERAEAFLRSQKQSLISRVAYWVGVDTIVVYDLLDKCIHRARALNLWLERAQHDRKLMEITSYVTALCVNYRNTGRYLAKEREVSEEELRS